MYYVSVPKFFIRKGLNIFLIIEYINTTYFQDTDSIVAIVEKGHKPPFCDDNNMMGDLADELLPSEEIVEWVSLGM